MIQQMADEPQTESGMDKEQFGRFVYRLRKEKNMTQKELGEKLHLTDKAVSKWERGLSYPDICVLDDLSQALDVSVVELLNGERAKPEAVMDTEKVQELIDCSLQISDEEIKRKRERSRLIIIICVVLIMLIFSICLNIFNYVRLQEKEKEIRKKLVMTIEYTTTEEIDGEDPEQEGEESQIEENEKAKKEKEDVETEGENR